MPTTYAIPDGRVAMAATLYTGNGGTQAVSNAVNGVGFQPDLVWGKLRTTSGNNRLQDSVRGADNTLSSNLTDAEVAGNGLVSFDAAGFTMDSGTNINQAYPYVAWQWKAGGTAGFDIVTCTTNGSGILTATSHNLGVVPAMVILKARTGTDAWYVYHQKSTTTPTQATLQLNSSTTVNTTNGSSGGVDKWTLTSTTFAAGNAAWTYQASTNHIAYLFAAVAGYSAFGSYTGNGSADGPFVYTAMRPRFIMLKRTDSTSDWRIYDSARTPSNADDNVLAANTSAAEDTASRVIDVLSNGFKLRDAGANNISGGTYIYMAFAENPFKFSNAR